VAGKEAGRAKTPNPEPGGLRVLLRFDWCFAKNSSNYVLKAPIWGFEVEEK